MESRVATAQRDGAEDSAHSDAMARAEPRTVQHLHCGDGASAPCDGLGAQDTLCDGHSTIRVSDGSVAGDTILVADAMSAKTDELMHGGLSSCLAEGGSDVAHGGAASNDTTATSCAASGAHFNKGTVRCHQQEPAPTDCGEEGTVGATPEALVSADPNQWAVEFAPSANTGGSHYVVASREPGTSGADPVETPHRQASLMVSISSWEVVRARESERWHARYSLCCSESQQQWRVSRRWSEIARCVEALRMDTSTETSSIPPFEVHTWRLWGHLDNDFLHARARMAQEVLCALCDLFAASVERRRGPPALLQLLGCDDEKRAFELARGCARLCEFKSSVADIGSGGAEHASASNDTLSDHAAAATTASAPVPSPAPAPVTPTDRQIATSSMNLLGPAGAAAGAAGAPVRTPGMDNMATAVKAAARLEATGDFEQAAELLAAAMEALKTEQDLAHGRSQVVVKRAAGRDCGEAATAYVDEATSVSFTVRDVLGTERATLTADGCVLGPGGVAVLAYIESDGRVGSTELKLIGGVTQPTEGDRLGYVWEATEDQRSVATVDYGDGVIRDLFGSVVAEVRTRLATAAARAPPSNSPRSTPALCPLVSSSKSAHDPLAGASARIQVRRSGEVLAHNGAICGHLDGFATSMMRAAAAYLILVDPHLAVLAHSRGSYVCQNHPLHAIRATHAGEPDASITS